MTQEAESRKVSAKMPTSGRGMKKVEVWSVGHAVARPPPEEPPTGVGEQLLRVAVRAEFAGHGTFDGIVVAVSNASGGKKRKKQQQQRQQHCYRVRWTDGEEEDMSYEELKPMILKSWREQRRLWGYPTDEKSSEAPLPPNGVRCLDGQIYVVRELLQQRKVKGKVEFLVDWEGYECPSWEPEDTCVKSCAAKIAEFRAAKARKKNAK